MQSAGLSEAAIAAFERAFKLLASKESGLIPESSIDPVEQLPNYEGTSSGSADGGLLAKAVMLKLNGGLGTGMGLEKAKSLLVVRNGKTFLDLIVRPVLAVRKQTGANLRFLLMNSFTARRGHPGSSRPLSGAWRSGRPGANARTRCRRSQSIHSCPLNGPRILNSNGALRGVAGTYIRRSSALECSIAC